MAVAGRSARKTSVPKRASSNHSAADLVDEQLMRYRAMRNFQITAEPKGGSSSVLPRKGLPFCIQKHAASHLHYDFRLGWNGVLKSWACAKGPSYFPGDKRLAVQVEDHPIEYGGFEGIIPAGQYGGGTVMVWDQGTWEPQAGHDVDAGLRDGSLKFVLHGTKLQGRWALIRMKGKAAREKKPNWLLIKEHDAFERGKDDPPITETEPDSVVTGRSIEQIAQSKDHVWNSQDTGKEKAWFRKDTNDKSSGANVPKSWATRLKKMPVEKQPGFVKPQLAELAATPPSGSGWIHELKLDGYRIQARKDGNRVQMFTRTGLDWTDRFGEIVEVIAALPIRKVTLDGEVVVLAPDGSTSFDDLQASFQAAGYQQTYFCFDVLHVEGRNVRNMPLIARKQTLTGLLASSDSTLLQVSEHLEADGSKVFRKACELRAEGIVSKKIDGVYSPGRSKDWLKIKCRLEQEFVIGGYTPISTGNRGVGALLLGYYNKGKLIYAGRTGTGFSEKTHKLLCERLEALKQIPIPFERMTTEARRHAIWVKPELVAQVRFAAWTTDNLVRQAAFLGLREDRVAKEITREESKPATMPTPKNTVVTDLTHAPIPLTHPAKILDTATGITKQVLADYYWAVAKWMLPYIADRPLSLLRCPDGAGQQCFFQKHANGSLPHGIDQVDVPGKAGKTEPYITLNSIEGLAGLAQISALEVHPWNAQNNNLERPDRLVFDLDPDKSLPWPVLAKAAADIRSRLQRIGLQSFLKTTGGKGLHIVVPIRPQMRWPDAKDFSRRFALDLEKKNPALYLTKMTKSARKGKIFIDYLRNDREATAVAAYSPRAFLGAPVSMPLHWKELEQNSMPVFHVADFSQWRSRLAHDPWKQFDKIDQQVPSL